MESVDILVAVAEAVALLVEELTFPKPSKTKLEV